MFSTWIFQDASNQNAPTKILQVAERKEHSPSSGEAFSRSLSSFPIDFSPCSLPVFRLTNEDEPTGKSVSPTVLRFDETLGPKEPFRAEEDQKMLLKMLNGLKRSE